MRKKLIIGLSLLVVIGGLAAFNVYKLNKSVAVELAGVEQGEIRETVFANGSFVPGKETVQYMPQSGAINRVWPEFGDKVQKDGPLVSLDTRDWEQQIKQEENNRSLVAAEKALAQKRQQEAAKELWRQGGDTSSAVDADELKSYELRLASIDMNVQALRDKIAESEIKVTASGVVTEIHVAEGQFVSQGMPIATVMDDATIRVRAFINELDAGKIVKGMKASVTGDAFEAVLEGEITFISPVAAPVDAGSRDPAVEIRIDINETDASVRPGYNAIAEIVLEEQTQLLIPLSSVRYRGDTASVYTVVDELAEEREVQLGKDDGERVEVLSGLSEGESIIVRLSSDIQAGVKVKEQ